MPIKLIDKTWYWVKCGKNLECVMYDETPIYECTDCNSKCKGQFLVVNREYGYCTTLFTVICPVALPERK